MLGVVVLVLIADTIAMVVLASRASPDRRNYIDEHNGDGSIRDDWALEPLDRAAHLGD